MVQLDSRAAGALGAGVAVRPRGAGTTAYWSDIVAGVVILILAGYVGYQIRNP